MIVGFDNDDATIFDEQLRFIQEARIPVSMTGMLQAMPKTPLHARVAAEGTPARRVERAISSCSRTSCRAAMTRLELYRGYRELVTKLYDFRVFRARALDFLLGKGAEHRERRHHRPRGAGAARPDHVAHGDPRVATARLVHALAARPHAARRPSAFADAVSLAVVHKALYDYVHVLRRHLDRAIAEIESVEGAAPALPG